MNTIRFQIWPNSVLLVLFTLLPAAPSKSHTAKKARLAEGTMYSDMGCDMEWDDDNGACACKGVIHAITTLSPHHSSSQLVSGLSPFWLKGNYQGCKMSSRHSTGSWNTECNSASLWFLWQCSPGIPFKDNSFFHHLSICLWRNSGFPQHF
jgi:hypothetical protein